MLDPLFAFSNAIEFESTLGQDDVSSQQDAYGQIAAYEGGIGYNPALDPNGNVNWCRGIITPLFPYNNIPASELAAINALSQSGTVTSGPPTGPKTISLWTLCGTDVDFSFLYGPANIWLPFPDGNCQFEPNLVANVSEIHPVDIFGNQDGPGTPLDALSGIVCYPKPTAPYIADYYVHPNGNAGATQGIFGTWARQVDFTALPYGGNPQSFLFRELPISGTSIVVFGIENTFGEILPPCSECAQSLHTINMDGTLNPADPEDVQKVRVGSANKTFNGPLDKANVFWFLRNVNNVPTTANGGVAFDPHDASYLGNPLFVLK